MYCTKCGSMNPEDSKFCQRCGAPMMPKANAPAPNTAAPQTSTVPPQNSTYMPQGAGYVPPQGAVNPAPSYPPPGASYIPPQGVGNTPPGYPPAGGSNIPPQGAGIPTPGYPPQNTGIVPPAGGYSMPNDGYGPPGYPPKPPKKKNPVFVAAGILAGLAVVIVAVVLLATMKPDKSSDPDKPGISSDVVLGDHGDDTPAQLAADGFRENYTQILGGGEDKVTVMLYVCGADLESDGGCGTLDINEMLSADLGDNVNVVLETGGCSSWNTQGIIDGEVQRWAVQDGALVELQELGQKPMLDSGELSDFISFAAENFPANRYDLIFWDHGGGSLYGYGSDEMYPDTVLFLSDIAKALDSSGVKFDFVGFDACLMGTIETAYMLEPYADYLIGSEETEPAYGWNYTPWLSALGDDPSIETVDLGKTVVDSFLDQNAASSSTQDSPDATLSVVALREIPKVYDTLCSYMSSATDALANKEFKTISTAVARSRAFADGDYDLIDIEDFANRAGLEGKDDLTAALQSAVKYSASTARTGVYGLSMYFPYKDLTVYGYAKDIFSSFGYGGPIYDFYDTFVSILAGGQKNSTSRSLKENLTGQADAATDYSGYAWYDDSAASSYADDSIDYTELQIQQDESTGNWYLPLTDEDWSLITNIEMQILLDDGEGYIDLGSDQYYETDDNNNLVLNYGADNTWVAIGGQIVSYYAEETLQTDAGTVFTGYVPAVLNGTTDIDIILEWDGEDSEGFIAGYRMLDSSYSPFGDEGTVGKGYKQFKPGDTIDFVCDYYTYDGDYDSSYYFGDTLTIGDTLPAVTYEDVGDGNVLECYMLVDIYQNYSWTETVEFSADNAG